MYRLQSGFPTKDALPRHSAYLKTKRCCCCPCVQRVSGRKCAEMKRMRTIGKELKVDLARPKMQPPTNRDCTQVHTMLSLNLDVDAAAAQVPTLTEMVGPSLIHHRLPPWVIIIVNLRFLLQGSYTHIPHDHIAYR